MSPGSMPIKDNLNQVLKGIKAKQAADIKDIPHHAQHATMRALGYGQPATYPEHHIVSQRTQQDQLVLGFKALFAAFGQSQVLFVPFESGLDVSSPLVIEGDVGQQDRDGISELRHHILALACIRLGENAAHGRGMDTLPASITDRFAETLVRSLDEPELRRALAAATRCLITELEHWDATLCARLRPLLYEFGLSQIKSERQSKDS